jgi:SAM-dependent methyltransferase
MSGSAIGSRWSSHDAPRGDDYDERFRALEATGEDVHGEADLVGGFAPGRVLDAGCGTGRVAIELARRGIETVGVDLDPGMLAAARANAPHLRWVEADLATHRLTSDRGPEPERFDVVVAAGNVMIFVAPGSEADVVGTLADHLAPDGRLIAGFQLQAARYDLASYDQHCDEAGLVLAERFATWDRESWRGSGDYAVSVHRWA